MAINKPVFNQVMVHDEEEMIDEIIETDPDEDQAHPVDDPIEPNNDEMTNFKLNEVEQEYNQMNGNVGYNFYSDEVDEEAIN